MTAPAKAPARRAPPRQATADGGTAAAPLALLAPTGRDAAVAASVLSQAGFSVRPRDDMATLCSSIDEDIGAVLVAEEALFGAARLTLLSALEKQPPWSDVPVIVLTGESELSSELSPTLHEVAGRGNVTLLERPVRVATLVTTVRSALRARQRQFDVRDHLIERAAAEAALHAARAQAEEANRIKGEFLAVMSHELRTPLNAIGGYADLIALGLRGPVTGEQLEDIRRIQQSQRHLLGLINQVLNYTRVDSGTVRYDLTSVPVHEALATANALIAPQARSRDLRCSFAECDRSMRVYADSDKLQQILLNLLTNAIKFTRAGGELHITCTERGDKVAISVGDTGIGIAPEKLANVFEPFVQVDSTLTRANEGVGLGLAISRDLARGMGGELTVESTVDVGSTFTLVLPRG